MNATKTFVKLVGNLRINYRNKFFTIREIRKLFHLLTNVTLIEGCCSIIQSYLLKYLLQCLITCYRNELPRDSGKFSFNCRAASIMNAIAILLITLIISICALFWKKRNRHLLELSNKLKGPPTLPILGNGLTIVRNPAAMLSYLADSQKEYGPVTRQWIGNSLYVYLSNPADVEVSHN